MRLLKTDVWHPARLLHIFKTHRRVSSRTTCSHFILEVSTSKHSCGTQVHVQLSLKLNVRIGERLQLKFVLSLGNIYSDSRKRSKMRHYLLKSAAKEITAGWKQSLNSLRITVLANAPFLILGAVDMLKLSGISCWVGICFCSRVGPLQDSKDLFTPTCLRCRSARVMMMREHRPWAAAYQTMILCSHKKGNFLY